MRVCIFLIWSKITINEFIFDDKRKLLTIPVLYNTSTSNAHNYLIRIILSIGEYNNEIDALTQQTTHKYIQHVGLIRENEDEESLKQYSQKLTRKYIEEQLVFLTNSLSKSGTFITMAKGVFGGSIIHHSLSMNELPPFTMTSIHSKN